MMVATATAKHRVSPLRQQIVVAAVEMTARSGWASVTMASLAELVGVSRQTVYNEVGSKPALAEAVVLEELARFLSVVELAFDQHPDDPIQSIHDAARGVLELARGSALLRAIVSATHGADTELLPLLTTRSQSLLAAATGLMAERLAPFAAALDARRFSAAIDVIVRLVLSHVMQPTGTPADTADDIAWIASRLLRPEASGRAQASRS